MVKKLEGIEKKKTQIDLLVSENGGKGKLEEKKRVREI